MKNKISRVEQMPNLPEPFQMRDWTQVSRDYDDLVFDFQAQGDFLPLPWADRSRINCEKDMTGLPSYINSKSARQSGKEEGINLMSAILGATVCGIDKSNDRGTDFVDQLEGFFNSANGQNLFLNTTSGKTGGSFWYETYPSVLMSALSNRYSFDWLEEKLQITADRYLEAIEAMDGDFGHTAFDFAAMKPMDNGRWTEPDAAAGYAFVLYNAYRKWGKPEYLEGAIGSLNFLEAQTKNPYYELLLPYGCYTAARLNAEHGCRYDLRKLVNWCFDGNSAVRPGWGVIAERWGELDCHGLCGSLTDWGQRWDMRTDNAADDVDPVRSGYAFAGNTFSMAAGLTAMVRYDTSYARDIGKWFLNAANSSRLFYPSAHSPKSQSCAFFRDDPRSCIAYEGLRKYWDGMSPYATGDPIRYSWGSIDLGLYGSSHVGLMGGIYGVTDDERILKLNLRATDFIPAEGFDSYLVYNPYPSEKTIRLDGLSGGRAFDAVSQQVLAPIHGGAASVLLPADTTAVIVCLPDDVSPESGI